MAFRTYNIISLTYIFLIAILPTNNAHSDGGSLSFPVQSQLPPPGSDCKLYLKREHQDFLSKHFHDNTPFKDGPLNNEGFPTFEFDPNLNITAGTQCYMYYCQHQPWLSYQLQVWALGFDNGCFPHDTTGWSQWANTQPGGRWPCAFAFENGKAVLECTIADVWKKRHEACSVFNNVPIATTSSTGIDACINSAPYMSGGLCHGCCCVTNEAWCTVKNPSKPPGCENINCPCMHW